MAKLLDHVCILVNDIDDAIERYKNIIGVTAPEVLEQPLDKSEQFAGKDRFASVVFRAGGEGCNIQLLQPLNPESPLYKRLEKYGEHIHHLGITSPHLEETVEQLKGKNVSLSGGELVVNKDDPSTRWTWILPKYAHGALIEVMDA
jgi:catechol 2,3-dioxygenase-like lactoylglutathione lyase family enzyme